MNVTCYTDAVIQAQVNRALRHHVAADVSVVIAAKQEAPTIPGVIDRTRRYAEEILVVAGRSTDGTESVASASGAKVLADGGRGKGEALRCAIPHIRTPITVFLDADGSHDPEDIPLLVEPILAGDADHVSASRLRGGSSELHGGFDEFFRLAGSSFITACINWRFGCQLSDSQNGFRAIRTDVLRRLNLQENITTIEQEMTIKTLRQGWRMAEVPSHEHRRTHGKSHIRVWRTAPRYGFSLVKYFVLLTPLPRAELPVNILGIWDGHDSGAALLQDGRVRFAVNEERLTRRKLDIVFPARSIQACLAHATLRPDQVHVVAASTSDPAKTLGRLWPGSKERYYAVRRRKSPPGRLAGLTRTMKYRITEWPPIGLTRAVSLRTLRSQLGSMGLGGADLRLVDHHDAHAQAAAWASGFDACAVLTIDGLGDGVSATISRFRDGRLERIATSSARCSLGVFFEHVTNLLNMRELEDEGKVMALADYAAPVPDEDNPLLRMVRVRDGVIDTERPSHALRTPLAAVHWRFANEQFAYMAQRTVERTVVSLARDAIRLTGMPRVALAGGVVSNVKATRQIRLLPEVEDIYVFPHMGDGGLALGAAVAAAAAAGSPLTVRIDRLDLGPSYDDGAIESALQAAGETAVRPDGLPARVADLLVRGQVVMWFQGAMEYGPRALGHRSVLARADRPDVRDRLNLALKRRVWYQPFCPSLLASEAPRLLADWTGSGNWAMTMAYQVADEQRCRMAGVTSVDGTCRPQIVADDDPGPFAQLLREMRQRLGAAVVLNTSFNIHGEPLVCAPSEAIDVFRRSGADALAIGPFLIERLA